MAGGAVGIKIGLLVGIAVGTALWTSVGDAEDAKPEALPATADQLVTRVSERVAALADYSCIADTESRLGDKTDSGSFQVWCKKPHQFRVKILRGKDKDAEIAVSSDGNIRAHKGGLLKGFVIRLEPTDSRLKSLRGTPVTDLAWDAFARDLHDHSALPGASATLATPADTPGTLEATVLFAQGEHKIRETYRVDAQTWLPVLGDVYEDDVRVDHLAYHDVNPAPNLDDNWFRL